MKNYWLEKKKKKTLCKILDSIPGFINWHKKKSNKPSIVNRNNKP